MSIRVRAASGADQEGIVRVIRAVYDEYGFTWDPETYHADLYDLDRYYRDRGDTFFVAEEDGQTLATAALELFPAIPGERGQLHFGPGLPRIGGCDCSIERLYVHPDARRRGLGGTMMRTVVEGAREAGRSLMEIWSDKRFVDAHRLYERQGARVVAERICDDPDVSPEWGLMLDLAS
jgi:putative acetyltransferase